MFLVVILVQLHVVTKGIVLGIICMSNYYKSAILMMYLSYPKYHTLVEAHLHAGWMPSGKVHRVKHVHEYATRQLCRGLISMPDDASSRRCENLKSSSLPWGQLCHDLYYIKDFWLYTSPILHWLLAVSGHEWSGFLSDFPFSQWFVTWSCSS